MNGMAYRKDQESVFMLEKMTRLTALSLELYTSHRGMLPVVHLPGLQTLKWRVNAGNSSILLPVMSASLTSLECHISSSQALENGNHSTTADRLIPASPVLRNLRELKLHTWRMAELPQTLTSGWANLTLLDLSINDFSAIPLAISKLTALRSLDMTLNGRLTLTQQDLVTLEALPDLQDLHLDMKDRIGLPELIAIARRFPDLHLLGPW